MAGIREYLEACHYRRNFLKGQLDWLQEERANYQADAQRLEEVRERIRQEMVGYLLPEVSDNHIAALERRLAYPGLSPIKNDYDGRFDAAENRRIELEAMDELQQHEYLIEQAKNDLEDVRPAYDKMKNQMGHWDESNWFSKLDARGYFEIDYRAGLLRRFFDWRDVSFLMSHLGNVANLDFDVPQQLREHYRHLREEAAAVFAAFEKRTAERDRIAGLKSEHEELLKAPERLLSELFHELGQATVSHLDACPHDLRLEIAREDPNLNAFLRKQTGTEKQVQYLKELAVTRVDSRIQQVNQELAKIDAKIRKLELQRRRGKRKRYSRNDLDRMRNVKADKWERKRAKTIKMRRKISEFDKHDRGSLAENYLWWDLMTGGATADDIFEVREFRQRHPNWNYRTYSDPIDSGVAQDALDEPNSFDDAANDLASAMASRDDDPFMDPS